MKARKLTLLVLAAAISGASPSFAAVDHNGGKQDNKGTQQGSQKDEKQSDKEESKKDDTKSEETKKEEDKGSKDQGKQDDRPARTQGFRLNEHYNGGKGKQDLRSLNR
jgi:hypothetical protein